MSDVILCRLVVGHETEMLEHKTENGHTHRWKVFVRSPANCPQFTDRNFVKKVTFYLHSSFNNPRRSVRNPPFELTETGYGGFDMVIQVTLQHVAKAFVINYEITLPMEKVSTFQLEQLLEVKNPPKELTELALYYGGRLKKDKTEKVKTHAADESAKHKQKDKQKPTTPQPSTSKLEPTWQPDGKPKKKKSFKPEDTSSDQFVDDLFGPPPKKHEKRETKEKKKHKADADLQIKGKEGKMGHAMPVLAPEKDVKKGELKKSNPKPDLLKPIPEEHKAAKSPAERNVPNELDKVATTSSVTQESRRCKSPQKATTSSIQKQTNVLQISCSDRVIEQATEMSRLPDVISPIPKTPAKAGSEVERLKRSIYVTVDRAKYHLPLLHKLQLPPSFIAVFERPIPLLSHDYLETLEHVPDRKATA